MDSADTTFPAGADIHGVVLLLVFSVSLRSAFVGLPRFQLRIQSLEDFAKFSIFSYFQHSAMILHYLFELFARGDVIWLHLLILPPC